MAFIGYTKFRAEAGIVLDSPAKFNSPLWQSVSYVTLDSRIYYPAGSIP